MDKKLILAAELMELTGTKKVMLDNMKMTMDHLLDLLKRTPLGPMAPGKKDIDQFFIKAAASQDELMMELAKLFAATYTEGELEGLIAFYKTPLGKAVLTKMPQVMEAGGKLGMQWGEKLAKDAAEFLPN